jgi:hypothetical protein
MPARPRRPRRALALDPVRPLEGRRLLAAPVAVDDGFSLTEEVFYSSGAHALELQSAPGDPIGGGVARGFDGDDGVYEVTRMPRGLNVRFRAGDGTDQAQWYYLGFSLPLGQEFAVGQHFEVTRQVPGSGPGDAAMDVVVGGQRATSVSGWFTVTEFARNTAGDVTRFAATFEQRANGGTAALTGSIRYNSATIVAGVLANDADPDGDPLTALLVGDWPEHGHLQFSGTGAFTYLPHPNFSGRDTFRYVASDGKTTSEPATVTLIVAPVNDPPVPSNVPTYTVPAATVLAVDAPGVLTNAKDADGDALRVRLVVPPASGTAELAEDGAFRYIPADGFVGVDAFTYEVSDGVAPPVRGTAQIEVTAKPPDRRPPDLTVWQTRVVAGNAPVSRTIGLLTPWEGDPVPLEYVATISVDDGGPEVAARFVGVGSSRDRQLVLTRAFARPGTFTCTVRLYGPGLDEPIVRTSPVVVDPAAAGTFTVGLDPASDTGVSSRDGITRMRKLTLLGTGPIGALVRVTGVPLAPGGAPFLAGQATVDDQGRWSLVTAPLADGAYRFDSQSQRDFWSPILRASSPTLLIDTVGPRVVAAALDAAKGRLGLTIRDERSGVAPVPAAGAWSVSRRLGRLARALPVSGVATSGGENGRVITLALDRGRRLAAGVYDLDGTGAGLTDLAGNALDGEFRGAWPTGDGRPGGALAARFTLLTATRPPRWSARG